MLSADCHHVEHDEASMVLNVEVQQQQQGHNDACTIVSFTASSSSEAVPVIGDHFEHQQHAYQQQQQLYQLECDGDDEKKEEYHPSINPHNRSLLTPSPTKMLSLYSLQDDKLESSHHAYAKSILSSGSMEEEEEEDDDDDDGDDDDDDDNEEDEDENDDDDDMILNVMKSTSIHDDDVPSSFPQRSIQANTNPTNASSPTTTTTTNRITLNTYNSILSISEDEDEAGDTTNTMINNNVTVKHSDTSKCVTQHPPEQEQVVPTNLSQHQRTSPSSPSSCLMDNDDEDDDDDESDYDHDADGEQQEDGASFASALDLGVDVDAMNGYSNEHHAADKQDECTKNHQAVVPLSSSSSSIENKNVRSSQVQAASTTPTSASNCTTACLPQKTKATSSCIPQTPAICTRSWCGNEAAITITTTPTTPTADMVVVTTTSPLSIPIPQQLPSSVSNTTDDDSAQPLILLPLPPPHPSTTTTTTTSHVLIKSPKGDGRGFFDVMTEHFVDSLCFPRDDNVSSSLQQQRNCCSSSSHSTSAPKGVAGATSANARTAPPQEQFSATPNNAAAAATHATRDSTSTSDVIAATDTSGIGTADPPSSTSSNAVCGSGGGGTSASSWTSPLFGPTSAVSSNSDDQRSLCLQDDIMVLLGCANSPNDDEMQKVWAWNQSILECPRKEVASFSSDDDSLFHPVSRAVTCGNPSLQNYTSHQQQYQYLQGGGRRRPRRRELHERAIRVHQLRTERGMPCYNKKPFLGRMKQMFTRPPISTATTKATSSTSSTKASTSPTSVTAANSQIDYWSSSLRYQQEQEKTHYGNLPMMMDDSNLFAGEYHNSHCSTRRVAGIDGSNDNGSIMTTSLPLRRSSRSMDDRILQQECKNDPLRKSKLEEHLNRRIGIGKNGSRNTTVGLWDRSSCMLYQEEEEDEDIGYDSDPGGLDICTTATATTTTTSAAARQDKVTQNKTQQLQRIVETSSRLSSSTTSTTSSSNSSVLAQPTVARPPLWDANVIETVQESLNMSWNITWHPGNNFDANGNNNNSRKIRIWIERGTIINSAKVMLEPNIIWRDCYQPEMSKQRKLNVCVQKSSQAQQAASSSSSSTPAPVVKPFTIRLLSVCRVLEAPLHDALDRSLYPLARPSCSFLLKTAAPDGKEYLFEAPTTAERDAIVHRWKICIARFAALAVVEDLDAICREFFVQSISSRVADDYYHW